MTEKARSENLNRILAADLDTGMDILIVSASNEQLERFWQRRLEETIPLLFGRDIPVIVITETWPGGAGNGLGTLYSFERACEKGTQQGLDLTVELKRGASIALYHTAGKGTRLAPLPASESNNKPGVRLPSLIKGKHWLTILEAVIKQTALYGPSRKGRLSVFWGDQIFIPSVSATYEPTHHADILVKLQPMPTEQAWQEEHLDRYGLVALDREGNATQIEKVTHSTIAKLTKENRISTEGGIGVSLGSFSLSFPLLQSLLQEFASELASRQGKFDSDPHFWMATTLDKETYAMVRHNKEEETFLKRHHKRMSDFRQRFVSQHPELHFFGAVDVGSDCYWWDYGTIQSYCENHLKLTQEGSESDAMREFYGLPSSDTVSHAGVEKDSRSCLIDCEIESGRVINSVLIGVKAHHVEVVDGIVLNTTAPQIEGNDFLLYNVAEKEPIVCERHSVRADVYLPSEKRQLKVTTGKHRNGSDDWHACLPTNDCSYEELFDRNSHQDAQEVELYRESLVRSILTDPTK